MKQSTLLNAPAVLQELPSHQNESKWKPEWRKQPPYPTVNRNPWIAQVVCICSQVRKTTAQEGANKHELLTNPGSTNCILFQNSLCCPAQPRLASLQLARERMRKKTSPFSPFHASMNSVHKQTPRRQIHNHLWGVRVSCTLSSTLGKQTGRECFTISTALFQKHFLYGQGNFPLEDANQNSNIDQSGDEGRNMTVPLRWWKLLPIHCHPPPLIVTDLSTFLKGQLKFLNSAVTDKKSKVLPKNSSEANYFSFCCRLRAIYWGFACSCLKLDLICLSSKCCKCKAISFTGFN